MLDIKFLFLDLSSINEYTNNEFTKQLERILFLFLLF